MCYFKGNDHPGGPSNVVITANVRKKKASKPRIYQLTFLVMNLVFTFYFHFLCVFLYERVVNMAQFGSWKRNGGISPCARVLGRESHSMNDKLDSLPLTLSPSRHQDGIIKYLQQLMMIDSPRYYRRRLRFMAPFHSD